MRIVRLANFVMARSGGLRTALRCLGAGYLAAGHDAVLVVPGTEESDTDTSWGRVITVRGLALPGTGGYRVLAGRRRVVRVLDALRPDRLEVSDRLTLRWTGAWARSRGIPAAMVSHESLAGLLAIWHVPGLLRGAVADALNRRTARGYDRVVCTTDWAAAEFDRIGAANVVRVPLGVDLTAFRPDLYDPEVRDRYASPHEVPDAVSCTDARTVRLMIDLRSGAEGVGFPPGRNQPPVAERTAGAYSAAIRSATRSGWSTWT